MSLTKLHAYVFYLIFIVVVLFFLHFEHSQLVVANKVITEERFIFFFINCLILNLLSYFITRLIIYLMLVQLFLELSLIQIVNILVKCTDLQPVEKLFFYSALDLGCFQRGGLPICLSLLILLVNPHQLLLRMVRAYLQLPLPYDHLMKLRQPLLAFMSLEFAPELQLLVDHLQSFLIVPR